MSLADGVVLFLLCAALAGAFFSVRARKKKHPGSCAGCSQRCYGSCEKKDGQ